MAGPKTTRELDISQVEKIIGISKGYKLNNLIASLKTADAFEKGILDTVKENVKDEEKRLSVYKYLLDYIKKQNKGHEVGLKLTEEAIKKSEELMELGIKKNKLQSGLNALYKDGNKLLQKAIENNAELFRISHEMQLESNVTWKNYTKLYNEAYKSVREANREIGQSVHNVKDLVSVQNQLLGAGWKNIDTKTLTGVSTSVMGLQRTLGKLDARLITAFENSYRIFGDSTDMFVTAIGNRLNAFSNTFGVQVALLQGAVVDMSDANNFIHRSNMQANLRANESLIKAAALSGAIGLTSTTFLSSLAKTAQFGTMEEMSQIYQGGALLQGFDTGKFQEQMIGGQYEDATRQLLGSIHETLSGIDDHYLRAEYMSRLSSTFGLSKDELARIATHGDKLGEYSADLQDKLLGVNTSMEDELKDLKMSLADRIENATQNFWGSQVAGAAMQELGLYGLSGTLNSILNWVRIIAIKPATDKLIGGLGGTQGIMAGLAQPSAAFNISKGAALGIGALGLGASQLAGTAIQQSSLIKDDSLANWLGGGVSALGGAASGMMMGSAFGIPGIAVGGLIGAGIGIANAIQGAEGRQGKLDELEASRKKARDTTLTTPATNEPLTTRAFFEGVNKIVNSQEGVSDKIVETNLLATTMRNTTTATPAIAVI